MSEIYVFGDCPKRAAEMVSFAHSLNSKCTAIICGGNQAEYTNIGAESAIYLGADMPESYAKVIASILKEKKAQLFAVAMSTTGRELAAKTAGYLDCPMICDVSNVTMEDGRFITQRMMYGGAVIHTEYLESTSVITVPTGKYPPASGIVAFQNAEAEPDRRVTVMSTAPIIREGVDITASEKVVGAGMGFSTKEELQVAYDLAAALGAEVGCSRSLAEDQHWFSEYIGLSGVQISPKLYVALGISGQIQHSVGVRGAQVIVAINRDVKAPFMTGCDYAVVGDMYELVPIMVKALKAL